MRMGRISIVIAIAATLGLAACRSDRPMPAPARHNVNGTTTKDTVPDARDSARTTDRSVNSAAPGATVSPAKDRINQSGLDDAANSTAGPNSGGPRDKAPDTIAPPADPNPTPMKAHP